MKLLTLNYVLLQHKSESGAEAFVLGLVSVFSVLIIYGIISGVKKLTNNKKDAKKIK